MKSDPIETDVTEEPKPKAKKAKAAKESAVEKSAAKKTATKKTAAKNLVAEEVITPEPEAKKKAAKKVATKKAAVPELPAEEAAEEIATEEVAAEAVTETEPVIEAEPVIKTEPVVKAIKKFVGKKAAAKKAIVAEPDAEEEIPAGPEPKLERLQKILARAGISSRRKAEELILGGQVQINGKVVMELGTKADPARDHVRVDGKLLQGPERIRYFVLNKPKGYVTTVSDPEGRPTVMQFFERENERLYPVGRLDYLSEGLLLVTNDGDLANKLTKASSGVEKTYLVKVAGQPTEDMLDVLRAGVVIEKGRPGTGSGRVRTAPAQIRQVRQGDNPWYEVIIIEGRNRELRKMFEEIGHHVEKIRRVGYGPLVLDLEPGKLRELEPEEVEQLRLTAAGKLKNRRRRGPAPAQLSREAGRTVRFKKADGRPGYEKPNYGIPLKDRPPVENPRQARPTANRPTLDRADHAAPNPVRPSFVKSGSPRPSFDKPAYGKPAFDKPGFKKPGGGKGGFKGKPREFEPPVTDFVVPRKAIPDDFDEPSLGGKGAFNPDYKPGFRTGGKPGFSAGGPQKRFGADGSRPGSGGGRPSFDRDRPSRARTDETRAERPSSFRPAPSDEADFTPSEPRKPSRIGIEPVTERPREARSSRPSPGGKPFGKPFQPRGDRGEGFAGGGKPFRPAGARPTGSRPPSGDRPFRPRTEGAQTGERPFRPRTDRPSGESRPPFRPKPFQGRGDGPSSSGSRPFRPRTDGPSAGGRPSFGRSASGAGGGSSRPGSSRSGSSRTGSSYSGSDSRPSRFTPRSDGPPARRSSFDGGEAPREFRPREPRSFGGDKRPSGPGKFGAGKSFGARKFDSPKPAPGGSNSKPSGKLGPDGQPRVKVRARDSFTGKNKGRPKPKPKSED
ncbi:pseudouridine synthase [Acidicapsa ligni]|uniref:pseudouridine synthase n=1 Tax=Acidicapsa ligni TaxID=542300 RepID=UPI0021E0AB1B|nr:pseudouridine synthase [Acidicapsa ligni]